MPFLAFGNSHGDYKVLACSATGRARGELTGIAEAIARQCEGKLNERFVGLVGVAPLAGIGYALFRVFDTGSFRGRPHNLGLVVVQVPPRSGRTWQLGDYAASLSPPTTDSTSYDLALPAASPATVATPGSVFVELNGWDARAANTVPNQGVVFSEPALSVTLQPGRPPSLPLGLGRRMFRVALVLGVLIALAMMIFAIHRGWFTPSTTPPAPTRMANDYGPLKSEMVMVLDAANVRGVAAQSGQANPNKLAAMVLDAEENIRPLLDRLRDAANRDTTRDEKRIRQELEDVVARHKRGLDLGSPTERADPPPMNDVKRAIGQLTLYDRAINKAQSCLMTEFNMNLNELRSLLGRAGS
jgi:hypothetical protein